MTEQEWFAEIDPAAMLSRFEKRGVSSRKLRLFAVACCLRILHLLVPDRRTPRYWDWHKAITLAEQYADGVVTYDDLISDWVHLYLKEEEEGQEICWAFLSQLLSEPHQIFLALQAMRDLSPEQPLRDAEKAAQVEILRDVFAPPGQVNLLRCSWLAWNDAAIPRMAQAIYDKGSWEDMPILGDALEDADCSDARLLDHLRGTGPHVRGCWALDLILGR